MKIARVKKKEGPRKWMTGSQMRSIPEYVIKKGRPHGHRHGKHPGNREYYLANDLKKRFIKRDYKGIHDRFLRDHIFRGRMIENSRDEEICRAWDVLAEPNHTYRMSESEFFHCKLVDHSQQVGFRHPTIEKTF